MVSRLVIFIFISVCWTQLQFITNAQVVEGTYTISNNGTRKLSLRANSPNPGQTSGDVEPHPYDLSAPFHWIVKKESWLYSLTPEANTNNSITYRNGNGNGFRGYQFRSEGNGAYLIEYLVGRRATECLKDNGEGQSVSFVNCKVAGNPPKTDSSFLWNFQRVIHVHG